MPCTRSRKRSATNWSAPFRPAAAVSSDCLRPPLAVHRGEVVTVYAQSGAVRIRTNARAHDEGSVGELVAVESLLNRSTYYARVSGVREVEVYARPPRVENQPAAVTVGSSREFAYRLTAATGTLQIEISDASDSPRPTGRGTFS